MGQKKTLCVVGLGLIGGSIAAAVKAKGAPWRVTAADRRRSALAYAQRLGFIDEACESIEEGVTRADLVILAVPVRAIQDLLESLAGAVWPGQIITDVGNIKRSVAETARKVLPEGVSFVGGHPIAGAERTGVDSALAGLFEGRTCVLTPEPDTDRGALETVTALWREMGSEVVYLSPETHDRVFALVSHLPHMVAYSLMNTVSAELPSADMTLAGAALRDFTRVTQSPSDQWREICLDNQAALLQAIDAFLSRLGEVRTAISEGNGSALVDFFERAAEVRRIPWVR